MYYLLCKHFFLISVEIVTMLIFEINSEYSGQYSLFLPQWPNSWNSWFCRVFVVFQFLADFRHFFGENLAQFKKNPKFHPKSAENQLKIKIFKKAYVRSSVLIRWRSGPSLGVILSSSSEKKFPPLNFKAKFYNMGNPIHFATCCERCRVRDITKFQQGKLFKFRKKFRNPCIPNFKIR